MNRQLLEDLRKEMARFGRALQPPCPPAALERLRARVRAELKSELPEESAEFLAVTNGLDYDGVVFYGSEKLPIAGYADRLIEGLVEANLLKRDVERAKRFLIFGTDGEVLFVRDLHTGAYKALDAVALDDEESYESFEALLSGAVEPHLDRS